MVGVRPSLEDNSIMKPYLISLAAGLLVGAIYALLSVRSPAPPMIALVGLLGMLVGEQIPQRIAASKPLSVGWLRQQCGDHVFGRLPAAVSEQAVAQRESVIAP
jgi:XapX domain-containing protein